ncbi:hypothetical protein DL89DRAFT_168771 [Linderina pennispora]|uniref:Uncharacterized protein n=1 Tax=Linderina pennispora TaxID=61395 RepID=A0A1Y1W5Z2_9FUNG|nr:uncharacterized protein DL89DRAFT_168771 [Linderina pennispora]ORX68960.1 hypothetical protein DL89DRAFT_168771 [Linderina pennispora]
MSIVNEIALLPYLVAGYPLELESAPVRRATISLSSRLSGYMHCHGISLRALGYSTEHWPHIPVVYLSYTWQANQTRSREASSILEPPTSDNAPWRRVGLSILKSAPIHCVPSECIQLSIFFWRFPCPRHQTWQQLSVHQNANRTPAQPLIPGEWECMVLLQPLLTAQDPKPPCLKEPIPSTESQGGGPKHNL